MSTSATLNDRSRTDLGDLKTADGTFKGPSDTPLTATEGDIAEKTNGAVTEKLPNGDLAYSTPNGNGVLKADGEGGYTMTNDDLAALEAQDKANHIGHWDGNPHHPHEDDHADEAGVRERDGTVVTFPDGGWRAWLVVLGAGHTLFCTFGFVVSIGLVQLLLDWKQGWGTGGEEQTTMGVQAVADHGHLDDTVKKMG